MTAWILILLFYNKQVVIETYTTELKCEDAKWLHTESNIEDRMCVPWRLENGSTISKP